MSKSFENIQLMRKIIKVINQIQFEIHELLIFLIISLYDETKTLIFLFLFKDISFNVLILIKNRAFKYSVNCLYCYRITLSKESLYMFGK